jgi:hypothetical protein
MFDFNDAPEQRGELIPAGTIATLQIKIRPGNAGEDGMLTRSKDGGCEMLDLEHVVVDGPHAKRKLWERYVLAGTTSGHQEASDISRGKLRAILESARGIKSDDTSEGARKARKAELSDFDGLRFIARIGIEKGKPRNNGTGENYSDRNVITSIITPGQGWRSVEQVSRSEGASKSSGAAAAPPIAKPSWAS